MVINPEGELTARYDKIHLFSYAGENQHVSAGNKIITAQTPWGDIGLSICYDIRFCELYRALALMGSRIILVPSAFPQERIDHWHTLLRARAIENQLFV